MTWAHVLIFAAVVIAVLSMPGCASTPSQLKESRVELKAVNPSALQTRPEYQKTMELVCNGHGGLGLVRKVEYSCNDGVAGHYEAPRE